MKCAPVSLLCALRFTLIVLSVGVSPLSNAAEERPHYRIAWTIYAGSMPLAYAHDTGILKKWGDRYGFGLEAVQMNDYIEAQTQFAAGQFDAVIAITLDALTIPAGSGVDTTAVVPQSTSAGSDGIIVRGKNQSVKDLEGKTINLVALSGSHYMLARALDQVDLSERDVTVENTSDADIVAAFEDPTTEAVATWKPQLTQIQRQYPDTTLVFDSSEIHGEIVDALVVHTKLLEQQPELGHAIAGAWFEATAMLAPDHSQHKDMMSYMANALETDQAGLESQLSTIDFFSPEEGIEFVTSQAYVDILRDMTDFAFAHGLLGEGAPNAGFIGIETGTGKVVGNEQNVQLRFPTNWLEPLVDE